MITSSPGSSNTSGNANSVIKEEPKEKNSQNDPNNFKENIKDPNVVVNGNGNCEQNGDKEKNQQVDISENS